jgi:Ca2+:H+ antiporter
LVKNEIRIVQASLLGSILANLLLILGMSFLIGGLRFREQIYNSTVTQMSACLLSLSVMSLLLPTAFHASFSTLQPNLASSQVLKVSRGTSVVLLVVYGMYLLFQLKSHAYMYESTPQHIIDEESAPGPVAAWMESSSDDSSSSSSSDSDSSSGSNTTAKRFRRVMRGAHRRHRKSSAGSKDTAEDLHVIRTPSFGNGSLSPIEFPEDRHQPPGVDHGAEGDDEDNRRSRKSSVGGSHMTKKERKKQRKRQERLEHRERKQRKKAKRNGDNTIMESVAAETIDEKAGGQGPRRVDFAVVDSEPLAPLPTTADSQRKSFNLLNLRPAIPKTFSQNVFMQPDPAAALAPAGPIPRVRYGIRRTNSLPDRLNQGLQNPASPPNLRIIPTRVGSLAVAANKPATPDEDDENISRTTAVMLLLISTGLVAVCAEFMVDSINAVVLTSDISEAFIGLIILPIVGNAAEHVTAVTVATKNKMDLAIGVAVGSSIQIGMLTPLPPSYPCPSPNSQLPTPLSPSPLQSPIPPSPAFFTHPLTLLNSTLRNTLHRPPRLGHEPRNVPLLHPLRNRLPLCLGLHSQLPRPRR